MRPAGPPLDGALLDKVRTAVAQPSPSEPVATAPPRRTRRYRRVWHGRLHEALHSLDQPAQRSSVAFAQRRHDLLHDLPSPGVHVFIELIPLPPTRPSARNPRVHVPAVQRTTNDAGFQISPE